MLPYLIAFASYIAFALATQPNLRVIFPAAFNPSTTTRRRGTRPENDQPLQVDIALSLDKTRISDAERALKEVSNPVSSKYGHHLTTEEVAELFSPDKQGMKKVVKWLTRSVPLASIRSSGNGHLYLNTTVAVAEKLFQTQYSEYVADENTTHAVFHEYSLPVSVSSYVDYIVPAPRKQDGSSSMRPDLYTPDHKNVTLEGFSQQARVRDAAVRNINCFQYITPNCLRALYNIPRNLNASAHPNNSMGFYTPAWSTWLAEDMDAFFTDFEPELVGERPVIENIDGGYRQTDVKLSPINLEANLDFQYSMSLAYPLPIIDLQVGDKYLMGNLNLMLAAFDAEYCKMALDANYDPIYPDTQPGGYNGLDCGTGHRGPAGTMYRLGYRHARYSYWPTNQTWSEGVGFPEETSLENSRTISGGGFSRHFPAPDYQAGLPKHYLHSSPELEAHFANLSMQGYFKPQGRGYPDVSAIALGYLINMYGQYYSVKGTSASTPVIASVIARVNDARLHAGKSTVGFINPVLYAFKDEFTRDVRNGSNSGCGVSAFAAIQGWDAVTGLGTVDFEKLMELYSRLP